MSSDAKTLIEKLKARNGDSRGIGFAADSLRMVYQCRDGKCGVFPEQLASDSDWQKALASDALTYQADGMDVIAIEGGKLQTKTAKKLTKTEGAQLDFEATITTTRRDRHGDVLESVGGRLDAKSPLLWQHIPFQPNGKLIRQTLQNKSRINAHLAVIDRPFADDAAALIEFNALRISHGFQPTEWEELDEDDDVGFRVTSFDIMEVSLVSVPANPDAEILDVLIERQSRKQFASPQVKLFAQATWNARPKSVVGGFEGGKCGCKEKVADAQSKDANVMAKYVRAAQDAERSWAALAEAMKKIAEQATAIERAEKELAAFRVEDADSAATKLIGRLMCGESLSAPLIGSLEEVIGEQKSTFQARCLEEFVS